MTKLEGERDYTLETRGTLCVYSSDDHSFIRAVEGVATVGEAFAAIAADEDAYTEPCNMYGAECRCALTLLFYVEGFDGDMRVVNDPDTDGVLWYDDDNSADVALFSYGEEYMGPDGVASEPSPFALAVYADGGPQRDWYPRD